MRLFAQIVNEEEAEAEDESDIITYIVEDESEDDRSGDGLDEEQPIRQLDERFGLNLNPSVLQSEVSSISADVGSVRILHPVRHLARQPIIEDTIVLDTRELLHEQVDTFTINLGSADLPRISCACHKLNIAVRHALKQHGQIRRILATLNRCNAQIRKRIKLNAVFVNRKCRLRLENATRWSSAFRSAFDKGAFDVDPELNCPIDRNVIECYFQVLKPVYLFSTSLQSNISSIADVIPGKKIQFF